MKAITIKWRVKEDELADLLFAKLTEEDTDSDRATFLSVVGQIDQACWDHFESIE